MGAAAAINLVFSPLSIYAALALAAAGAGGRTLKEILKALGVRSCSKLNELLGEATEQALADQLQSGGPNIAFACGVWHDEGWALLPEFQEAADASYKAEARAVDFRKKFLYNFAFHACNRRMQLVTSTAGSRQQRITSSTLSLVRPQLAWTRAFCSPAPSTSKETGMCRFPRSKPRWKSSSVSTAAPPTHRSCVQQGDILYLSMMGTRCSSSYRSPSEMVGGIQPKYSMCIFLPDVRDGLPELTDRITSSSGFPGDYLPDKPVPVGKFRLPKFKLSSSGGIRQALTDCLGIKNAFDAGEADFLNLANGEGSDMPLSMTEVAHKAMLEVNEKGASRATAATTFGMRILASRNPAKDVDFVADHPFMFFVIEEVSGAIMLAGHVLDPST
ncbi:hypothetical protein PR202_ga20993 [Eleusine coracana subsp. coracana]|uniref:Serpin domain-containing protein n=1 Tax=Eleusine coracana subsp. coracana TaxID=191504 RepID=A0AAV5CY16_ELECO|nr:hypothetical protein PR202_ga20993 [Eleusine coracana subsp. coracana]